MIGDNNKKIINSPPGYEESSEPQAEHLPDGVKTTEKLVEPSSSQKAGMSGAAKGFWGTIILFAIITICLTVAAEFNKRDTIVKKDPTENELIGADEASVDEKISPEQIRPLFETANIAAIEETLKQAELQVRNAFAPTFERLPAYVDWHYSVWGSYEELADGATGDPSKELRERVFFDLDNRLSTVANNLDEYYESVFETTSVANFKALKGPQSGLIADTQSALIGTIAQKSVAVITLAGAKKVGPTVAALAVKKVATKFAAKMGSKWLATLGGLTAGTGACIWAGPGAPICGVIGATAAWFGFDYGAVKLDEYITRDNFSKELEAAIEESITEQIAYFTAQIYRKAELKKRDISKTMQDFTLKQLHESDKIDVCTEGAKLVAAYEELRLVNSGRQVESLVALELAARDQQNTLGLFELSAEILEILNEFQNTVRITPILVSGALHPDIAAKRSISGRIRLNGTEFQLEKTSYQDRFSAKVMAEEGMQAIKSIDVPAQASLKVTGELEQHLYLRNRHLSAGSEIKHSELRKGSSVSLVFYESDSNQPSYGRMYMKVEPEILPKLELTLGCEG